MRVMQDQVMSASLISGSHSWSRQCRRARIIHDQDRSTAQRRVLWKLFCQVWKFAIFPHSKFADVPRGIEELLLRDQGDGTIPEAPDNQPNFRDGAGGQG